MVVLLFLSAFKEVGSVNTGPHQRTCGFWRCCRHRSIPYVRLFTYRGPTHSGTMHIIVCHSAIMKNRSTHIFNISCSNSSEVSWTQKFWHMFWLSSRTVVKSTPLICRISLDIFRRRSSCTRPCITIFVYLLSYLYNFHISGILWGRSGIWFFSYFKEKPSCWIRFLVFVFYEPF